jgi:sulfite reductase (ferredoxin)
MAADPHRVPEPVLRRFEAAHTAWKSGSLSEEAYKLQRLSVGGHRQRGGEAMMLRLRVPGGRLSLEAFAAALGLADCYSQAGRIHLTLRQDLQLYGLAPEALPDAVRAARDAGLGSYASGGSTVRNVTCSILALEQGAPFDPYPYALALSQRLARHPLFNALPRKIKMGFGAPGPEEAQAWLNDLGFLPQMDQGRPGFRLIAGGGLGASPQSGVVLEPWIPGNRVGPWAEAVLELFAAHAPQGQPQRNRFKHVLRAMGLDAARAALDPVLAAKEPDRAFLPPPVREGASLWLSPALGDLDARAWLGLLPALRRAGVQELRVSFDQRLLLPGLEHAVLPELAARFENAGVAAELHRRAERLVVCTGPESCNRGLVNSRALGRVLQAEPGGWPCAIHVSGCTNGCSQHSIAPLSLQGLSRRGPQGPYPAYALRLGEAVGPEGLRFGPILATWPARAVPEALRALRQAWKDEPTAGSFIDWLRDQGVGGIKRLSEAWTEPSWDRYRDLGTDEAFAVSVGASECH